MDGEVAVVVDYPRDIKNLVLPETINGNKFVLNNCLFWGNDLIESLTISSGVVSIGDYCISKCSRLTTIIIHEGLKKLGHSSIDYCKALTSITFPSTIENVYDDSFSIDKAINEIKGSSDGLYFIVESIYEIFKTLSFNLFFSTTSSTLE